MSSSPSDAAMAPDMPLTHSSRPLWRIVLSLALPVLLQQALILTVSLSDRWLAGHLIVVTPAQEASLHGQRFLIMAPIAMPGVGPVDHVFNIQTTWESARRTTARQTAYQSAQTTANYLAWFISCYTVLVSVGSTALVARFTGAGDHGLARHITNQSILLAVILGVTASAAALAGGLEALVWLVRLQGEAAEFAVGYLRPLFILLVFQILQAAGIACLVGAGDTRTGLWVTMGVAIVNIPLAWGFCLGLGPLPELGFAGIAWGTAISYTLGGSAVLLVLARGKMGLTLNATMLWPRADLLRRILRVSVPAGMDSLSLMVGQFWILSIVNRLGDEASGAHGIAIQWEALGYLSGAAFGTAAMTLVGQNLGAGKPEQAAHAGWVAFRMGCAVMSVMAVIFFVLAEPMFLAFCPYPWQRPIVELGVPVLRLVAFAMPPLAACIVFTNALRGAGDTRVPVLFTWIGFFVVRIPLAYILMFPRVEVGPLGYLPGADLGLFGAWLAMFADLFVRGVFFLYRFARGPWRDIKV